MVPKADKCAVRAAPEPQAYEVSPPAIAGLTDLHRDADAFASRGAPGWIGARHTGQERFNKWRFGLRPSPQGTSQPARILRAWSDTPDAMLRIAGKSTPARLCGSTNACCA